MNTDWASGESSRTVMDAAGQCMESFHECLVRASSFHAREYSKVEDELARFSTWTSVVGVFAPGRASVDHRLQNAADVQSTAIGLLESLDYRIQRCSESFGTHSILNDPETVSEALRRSYGDIATEINHLNKMSGIIRRADQEAHMMTAKIFQTRNQHFESSGVSAIPSDTVEPNLLAHYERYIGERFPIISRPIKKRLAGAMVFRRQRILSRRSAHESSAAKLAGMTLAEYRSARTMAPTTAYSQMETATTLQPDIFTTDGSDGSGRSVISDASTIALDSHEPLDFPKPPQDDVNRYFMVDFATAGVWAKDRASANKQFRDGLKSYLDFMQGFTCPYCLYSLPADEVHDIDKWKNHVKNDLDPYVCLFEHCDQADELYKHSEGWLNHMRQHGRRWCCPSHRELGLFQNREEYMQHMREVHKTRLSDVRLRALAKRSMRSIPKLFQNCPLCGEDEAKADGPLESHIAGHLRSLALKSIPSYEENAPSDGETDEIFLEIPQPRRSAIHFPEDERRHKFWQDKGVEVGAMCRRFDAKFYSERASSPLTEWLWENPSPWSPFTSMNRPDRSSSDSFDGRWEGAPEPEGSISAEGDPDCGTNEEFT